MAQLSIEKIITITIGIFVLVAVLVAVGIAFKDRIIPYFRDLIGISEEPVKMFLGVMK